MLVELARYDEAEALLEETIRVAAARQQQRTQFDAMMRLADVHIETGDLERAAAQLDKLTPFAGNPNFDRFRQALMAHYQGRLAQARGDQASARSDYSRAVEVFDAAKAKIALNVRALLGLGQAEQALGDLTRRGPGGLQGRLAAPRADARPLPSIHDGHPPELLLLNPLNL